MIFDLILLALVGLLYWSHGRQLGRNQQAMLDLRSELVALEYKFRALRAKGDA